MFIDKNAATTLKFHQSNNDNRMLTAWATQKATNVWLFRLFFPLILFVRMKDIIFWNQQDAVDCRIASTNESPLFYAKVNTLWHILFCFLLAAIFFHPTISFTVWCGEIHFIHKNIDGQASRIMNRNARTWTIIQRATISMILFIWRKHSPLEEHTKSKRKKYCAGETTAQTQNE